LAWPVNSEKSEGRNVISRATSGLVNTSEIGLSAIDDENGQSALTFKAK
jgi:hypothetical protein